MALPLQHPVVRPNASGRRRPEDRDVSWRERLQALKHLPRLLRLVWETEPRYVVGILVLRVLRSLVPLAVLWVGKLIVDEVVTAIGSVHAGGAIPWTRLGQLLLLELVIALVGEGLSRVSALLESLLGDLFANRTSVELMRHAATLDLEQFENAEVYDSWSGPGGRRWGGSASLPSCWPRSRTRSRSSPSAWRSRSTCPGCCSSW